jgi:ADP-heptose:LPS heptosyltransferase
MARILVIQLGRLGDVIQTTPLLRELLAQNDDGGVEVLVFDSLREIVEGLGLGAVHGLSENSIPVSLRQLDKSIELSRKRHEPMPREGQEALRSLALPSYDRIVNCTYSPLGALVAQHTHSKDVIGPVINAAGELLFHHPAHIYLCARAFFREQNWFNLVDLWRAGGRLTATPLPDTRSYVPIASKLPFDVPSGRIVALNPGSSETVRRWPAANFALLAEGLASRGMVPALVGAPSDRETCEEVQARSSVKIANFCGKTSVSQLALFLTHANLLVSNDTGAIHIAAAAGCRVLALFGATAYFAETAPWSEGHVVLQGPMGSDVVLLHPRLVLAAAFWRLGLIDETDLRREIALHKCSAWETYYLQPDADPLGGIAYRPLHQDNFSSEQDFTRELRHLFARVFCEDERIAALGNLPQNVARSSGSSAFGRVLGQGADVTRFVNALESMADAAARCRSLSVRPTQRSAAEISSLTSSLVRAIEELKTCSESSSIVKPVVHFLDWSCRMMEPMSPEQTFLGHAQAYRVAARLLREAELLTDKQVEGLCVGAR